MHAQDVESAPMRLPRTALKVHPSVRMRSLPRDNTDISAASQTGTPMRSGGERHADAQKYGSTAWKWPVLPPKVREDAILNPESSITKSGDQSGCNLLSCSFPYLQLLYDDM